MAWTSPRTWVAGETVTASLLNTHLRDNLLETAPAKAAAAGDMFYATAANAIDALSAGTARQLLRMNADADAPEWANMPEIHIPLAYAQATDSGSYEPVSVGSFTYNASKFPAGATVYFTVVWSAANADGGTNQAKVGLRDITAGSDLWSSTQSAPVAERKDRNTVTLVDGRTYQVWAQAEQAGQACNVHEAKLEFIW